MAYGTAVKDCGKPPILRDRAADPLIGFALTRSRDLALQPVERCLHAHVVTARNYQNPPPGF